MLCNNYIIFYITFKFAKIEETFANADLIFNFILDKLSS